jgi:LemA protein
MSTSLIILAIVACALVAAGVAAYLNQIYNSLVALRHDVEQAWSNVDLLLKQRHDEVVRLLDAVRAAGGEPGLMTELTAQMAEAEPGQDAPSQNGAVHFDAEVRLSAGASRLLAATALHPTLRSDEHLHQVQERITALEEQLRHRREYYNELVTISNARREQFPDRLLATRAGLAPVPLLIAAGDERFPVTARWEAGALQVRTVYPFQGRSRPDATR